MASISLLIISHIQSTPWCVCWPIWIGNVICGAASDVQQDARVCLEGAEGFDINLSTQVLPLHHLMLEIPQMWAEHTAELRRNIIIIVFTG